MEYRQLGQSDLKVSAITFGAWAIGGWMWGGAERKDAKEAIRTSIDQGVTSIDTAPIYGQGTSEEIVGEALEGVSRDKVQILTKFGLTWEGSKGQFYFSSKDNSGKDITFINMPEKRTSSGSVRTAFVVSARITSIFTRSTGQMKPPR